VVCKTTIPQFKSGWLLDENGSAHPGAVRTFTSALRDRRVATGLEAHDLLVQVVALEVDHGRVQTTALGCEV